MTSTVAESHALETPNRQMLSKTAWRKPREFVSGRHDPDIAGIDVGILTVRFTYKYSIVVQ